MDEQWRMEERLRVAPARGLCASRGCPGVPTRGIREANAAKAGRVRRAHDPEPGTGPAALTKHVMPLQLMEIEHELGTSHAC